MSCTYEDMLDLAGNTGSTYYGSHTPKGTGKATAKEPWLCSQGHGFEATPKAVRLSWEQHKRNGCVYCWGSSCNYKLDKSGEFARRLEPIHLEVVGKWNGTKQKSTFHCLECELWMWDEFGLSILHQGQKCPVCFPRRGGSKRLNIRRYVAPSPITAVFEAMASPPG